MDQPVAQQHQQGLAAGQNLRVVTLLVEYAQDFFDGAGFRVFNTSHVCPSPLLQLRSVRLVRSAGSVAATDS